MFQTFLPVLCLLSACFSRCAPPPWGIYLTAYCLFVFRVRQLVLCLVGLRIAVCRISLYWDESPQPRTPTWSLVSS